MKLLLALILTICLSITAWAYQPRWTYPGSIEHHLRTTHGYNVSGMSHTDMLRLHDSLHEGQHRGQVQRTQSTHRRFFFRRMR